MRSELTLESIFIRTYSSHGPYMSFDDKYLRAKSYRYKTDEALGLKYKSYAFIDLKPGVKRMEIFTKVNINVPTITMPYTF